MTYWLDAEQRQKDNTSGTRPRGSIIAEMR